MTTTANSAADTGLPDEAKALRFALIVLELPPALKRALAAKAEATFGPDNPAAAKIVACLRELAEKEDVA